jgi:hypothetical protein
MQNTSVVESTISVPVLTSSPTEEPIELSYIESDQKFPPAHNWDVAIGDIDGDGDLDSFVANDSSDGNKLYINDVNGSFVVSDQVLEPCLRGKFNDLDGDGDLDLIITNMDSEKATWLSHASVWLNDGSGVFEKSQDSIGGTDVFNLEIADLNGDGHPDIFFVAIGLNSVWINNGNGYFTDSNQILETGIDAAVALGDLDQDGDFDALTGGWEGPAKVWMNDGSGNFVLASKDMTGDNLHIHDLALGDIDGDGDLDAVAALANRDPHQIWLNNGHGVFSLAQELAGPLAHGVFLGDLDNDSDADIAIAHGSSSGGYVKIWLNDGNGKFSEIQLQLGNAGSTSIEFGDFDNDDDLDAFIAHTNWGNQGQGETVSVWFNNNP